MRPDSYYIGYGIAALCMAGYLAFTGFRLSQQHRGVGALLWTIFGVGLLVQGFAPHLQIAHNKFIVPPDLVSRASAIHPAEIVARERWMQLISSLLMTVATLGLAFHYHRLFLPARLPEGAAKPVEI